MRIRKNIIKNQWLLFLLVIIAICFTGVFVFRKSILNDNNLDVEETLNIEEYSGEPYIEVNGNIPFFENKDFQVTSYENYWKLDSLGRCTGAMACIGIDLMPTEERKNISEICPTGWQKVEYDFIDQKYLYNRCHLIAFQLTGENANECNLITGTRYLNTEGMLPFENMISNYVRLSGNHVLYRVRPIFNGDNLLASGVLLEAYSIEDSGEGICFNVYCYNVQPGVIIDYLDGSSVSDGTVVVENTTQSSWYNEVVEKENISILYDESGTDYVLNTRRKKIHKPECSSVNDMSPKNTYEIKADIQKLIDAGYSPCQNCKPE